MGADLYINSIYKPWSKEYDARLLPLLAERDALKHGTPEYIKFQEEKINPLLDERYENPTVSGYFRDSYNSSSVLGFLDLSWWQDFPTNAKGQYSTTACKKFIRKITAAKEQKVKTEEDLSYFRNKRTNLIRFIELAIDLNEPIVASI